MTRTRSFLKATIPAALLVGFLLPRPSYVASDRARAVQLINGGGGKVDVFWMDEAGRIHLMKENFDKQEGALQLDTFVNHTFILREIPTDGRGACDGTLAEGEEGTCRVAQVTVGEEKEDQVYVVKDSMEIEHLEASTTAKAHASELLTDCREPAIRAVGESSLTSFEASQLLKEVTKCMESRVMETIITVKEEIAFESQTRLKVSAQLENYTCADDSLPTTPPIETRTWTHDGNTRIVHVLHDRAASKIHAVKNFITPEECEAIERAAKKKLHKATVADGKGGSQLSPNRKAMQAGVSIPWELEEEGNGIATASRRLYDYINDVTGYGIQEEGQEDIMAIHYHGRGKSDTEPDRYMPHCDGDCGGLPHKRGGRVATMVMYCEAPESGGATNFQNANVHVKPEVGTAVFFSYLDSETNKMDAGFTQHSGCPVVEGDKKIAVQWLRIGVDAKNPWDSFNTLTVKYSDEDL